MIPFLTINISSLLNKLSTTKNHSEHAQTNPSHRIIRDLSSLKNKAKKRRDNVQSGLIEVAKQAWHNSQGEKLDVLASACRRSLACGKDGLPDNVQLIQVNSNHSPDYGALTLGDVSENSWDGLLSLAEREECDEWVHDWPADWLGDLEFVPQLLIELCILGLPIQVGTNKSWVNLISERWWLNAVVVFHVHKSIVNILDIAKDSLAVVTSNVGVLGLLAVLAIVALDVEQWLWSLRVAEGDFSQASLNDKLLVLWLILGSLDGTLNLLLHSLHVVVATSCLSSHASVSSPGLEEVGLGKVAQWLTRMLSWSSAELVVNLIVEILRQGIIVRLIWVASCGDQLLQLNSGDKILILWSHETVVLGQEEDLVVALGPLCILKQECRTLLLGKILQLLWMSDNVGTGLTVTWTLWHSWGACWWHAGNRWNTLLL